ncbi:MAG: hypothetical protein ACRDRN_11920 [Sciscionella sp.]
MLVVVAVIAVGAVVVMFRTSRRSVVAQPPLRPALGSPAQVWVERGERVNAELAARLDGEPGWAAVTADAESVLFDLRECAGSVAAYDQSLSGIDVTRLNAERDRLAAEFARAPENTDLREASSAVAARLAVAERERAARDAVLRRMQAAVAGLERCRDEAGELLSQSSVTIRPDTSPTGEMLDRLAGLRAGLAEVREISGSAGEGTP